MSDVGSDRAPLRGRILALLLLTAFFTVAALAHVWVRLQVVRLGYQISLETDKEKELLQRHRKLQVEMALLRSPERLERLASEKLRLTMPDPKVIHDLGQGRSPASRSARRAR